MHSLKLIQSLLTLQCRLLWSVFLQSDERTISACVSRECDSVLQQTASLQQRSTDMEHALATLAQRHVDVMDDQDTQLQQRQKEVHSLLSEKISTTLPTGQ